MGGGGKIAPGQELLQGLNQFLLVFFDRQRVIAPAIEEDLLGGLDLGVERVSQRRLVVHGHFGQQFTSGGDFVAGLFDRHGA